MHWPGTGCASTASRPSRAGPRPRWHRSGPASTRCAPASRASDTRCLRKPCIRPSCSRRPDSRTGGIWRNGWVANNFGFDQGFDLYVRPLPSRTAERMERRSPSTHPLLGNDFDATEAALEFVRAHAQGALLPLRALHGRAPVPVRPGGGEARVRHLLLGCLRQRHLLGGPERGATRPGAPGDRPAEAHADRDRVRPRRGLLRARPRGACGDPLPGGVGGSPDLLASLRARAGGGGEAPGAKRGHLAHRARPARPPSASRDRRSLAGSLDRSCGTRRRGARRSRSGAPVRALLPGPQLGNLGRARESARPTRLDPERSAAADLPDASFGESASSSITPRIQASSAT